MRVLKITVKGAGLNVPASLVKKKALVLNALPLSTAQGMVYSLLGLRPPNRRNSSSLSDESVLIKELMKSARYSFNTLPKLESYYGRRSKYTDNKNIMVTKCLAEEACGIEFIHALETVFKRGEFKKNFSDFRDEIFSRKTKEEAVPEKIKELQELEKEFTKNSGLIEGKNYWYVRGSYIDPKNSYEKFWAKRRTPFGKAVYLGVTGGPKRKFTIDADMFFHFDDPKIESYLKEKLVSGPGFANFAEGGIAYLETPKDSESIFLESHRELGEFSFCNDDHIVPRAPKKGKS